MEMIGSNILKINTRDKGRKRWWGRKARQKIPPKCTQKKKIQQIQPSLKII